MNPDSAIEIEVDGRAWREPGAAKTYKRIVSRSCLALGTPLRFASRNYPIHRSRLTAKGHRPIGFAMEGLRQAR
ncbi:MAG: hypothetical protein ACM3TN_08860, partial [Alphaproteobacteria bacterium]